MTIFVLLDLLLRIVTIFISLKTYITWFSCKKYKTTTVQKTFLWKHLVSKAGFFSCKLYFHINSEAYDILTPVIDFMAVGLHGKLSRIIVCVEEGLKHPTCFKHGLKWRRLRALAEKGVRFRYCRDELWMPCSAHVTSTAPPHFSLPGATMLQSAEACKLTLFFQHVPIHSKQWCTYICTLLSFSSSTSP
jgi:hypothetical protein